MVASKLLLAIATIGVAFPAQAAPAPIVFDFEDGLQGWELNGATTRVQTQVLGGGWAIFGDGLISNSAFMSIEIDLIDIASISLERFFVEGDEDGLGAIVEVDLIENIVITVFYEFEVVDATIPNLLAANLAPLGIGPAVLQIRWNRFVSDANPSAVAFIDNITFHPVPEPETLMLVGIGIIGLAALRAGKRRQRGRAILPALFASLVLAVQSAQAAPAPIVFDFEDQTSQGWRLSNAILHHTFGVFSDGVDWAIFGLDGSLMEMTIDLTNIANMTWEEFNPSTTSTSGFAIVVVAPGNTPPFDPLGRGVPLSSMNPRERFFDLSMLTGTHEIVIGWNQRFPSPGEEFPEPTLFNTGFINTITFHPVPEPSSWLLLSLGIAGMVMIRRKLASRA